MAAANSDALSPALLDARAHLDPAISRRLERLGLADKPGQWVERYLLCEQAVDPASASSRQKFEATSRFIRDLVAHRWVMTRRARAKANPKRIH
jgi:glycogen phosphorylase